MLRIKIAVLFVLIVTLVAISPAAAEQHWGDFKQDQCTGDGLRQYSSVLWDIPFGASWEAACASMPGTINGQTYLPARCKSTGGHMWGEFDVPDSTCSTPKTPTVTNTPAYTQFEQDCFDSVQNKVAWNKAGNNSWSEVNLRTLCKGTTNPAVTISCFKDIISNSDDWSRGIRECSGPVQAGAATPIGNEEDLAQREVERQSERPMAGVNTIQKPYFENGTKIALIADNGMRMTRCNNCQESVDNALPDTVVLAPNGSSLSTTFEIEMVSSGATRGQSKSILKTETGKAIGDCSLCIVGGGAPDFIGIQAIDPYNERNQFEIEQLSNGKFALKAFNGMYVSRCHQCSPSFAARKNGYDVVTAHVPLPTIAMAQWTIEVVSPPYGSFPSPTIATTISYAGDPQGIYTKTRDQLEKDCSDQVQGHIAWDSNPAHTVWSPENLTALCKDTLNPWDTIGCFRQVIQDGGDINKGIGLCNSLRPGLIGNEEDLIQRQVERGEEPPTQEAIAYQEELAKLPLDSFDMGKVMTWIANRMNAKRTPFCWRDSFTRTGGTNPPTIGGPCPAGTEQGGATCFPPCNKENYDGVLGVCWQRCPSQQPVNCGAGCALTSADCGWTIFDQVSGPLMFIAFAASKGGAADKTEAAEVATNAGKLERAIVSITDGIAKAEKGLNAALVTEKGSSSVADIIKVIKATKDPVLGSKSIYKTIQDNTDIFVTTYSQNFAELTSPEIAAEISKRFGPEGARQIKEQWALSQLNATLTYTIFRQAKDILTMVSVVDPTGILSTINAYAHPICSPELAFPEVHPRFLN